MAYGAQPLSPDSPALWAFAKQNVTRSPDFYMAVHSGDREHTSPRVAELRERLEGLVQTAITREADRLYQLWRGQWLHQLAQPNGYHPSAAEVNEWSIGGMGHDAINQGVCVEARCAREGVPYLCAKCGGSATIWPSPEIEQKCEDWRRTDPPSGDGYQLWSTTSEGTPISPVFGTLEELCAWAEVNATTFGSSTATAAEWKKMLAEDVVHASDEEGNAYL